MQSAYDMPSAKPQARNISLVLLLLFLYIQLRCIEVRAKQRVFC